MNTVRICCEGPDCNGGHSAIDREQAIIGSTTATEEARREEVRRFARSTVSRKLAVTPHRRVGKTRYACIVCEHERVYGAVTVLGY